MGIAAPPITTTQTFIQLKMQSINQTIAVKPVARQQLRSNATRVFAQAPRAMAVKRDVSVRAGFIGSPENVIVCANTAALLFAGRFGLAPTVNKNYTAADSYTMVEAERPPVMSRDPAGFTAVDVLAFGSLAHMVAAGEILGLHAIGKFEAVVLPPHRHSVYIVEGRYRIPPVIVS